MSLQQPLISCICPTFGKIKTLEEAVQSFLLQDYPNKELIIFNNYPKIDFVYENPLVTVVNYKGDLHSAGEARNLAGPYAKGQYIVGWDDDDITLPKKLSSQMALMEGYIAVATDAYYSEYNNICKNMGTYFNSVLFEKSFWEANPYAHSNADDTIMYDKLNATGKMLTISGDPQYIYRWGTGTFHVSGIDNPNISQRERMMQVADSENFPAVYELKPNWTRDYVQDVQDFLLK